MVVFVGLHRQLASVDNPLYDADVKLIVGRFKVRRGVNIEKANAEKRKRNQPVKWKLL